MSKHALHCNWKHTADGSVAAVPSQIVGTLVSVIIIIILPAIISG